MRSNQKPLPITELADEFGLEGDIRTWFIQTAGLHQTFPRVILDGIINASIEQTLDWFSEQGLDHVLIRSGYFVTDQDEEDDESGDDSDGDENPPPRRVRRLR